MTRSIDTVPSIDFEAAKVHFRHVFDALELQPFADQGEILGKPEGTKKNFSGKGAYIEVMLVNRPPHIVICAYGIKTATSSQLPRETLSFSQTSSSGYPVPYRELQEVRVCINNAVCFCAMTEEQLALAGSLAQYVMDVSVLQGVSLRSYSGRMFNRNDRQSTVAMAIELKPTGGYQKAFPKQK